VVLKSSTSTAFGQDYLWVDPTREHVILRWFRYEGTTTPKPIWATVDITYRKADLGWLPSTWVVTFFRFDKERRDNVVDASERLSVSSVDLNPKLDIGIFQVSPSPGEIVEDLAVKKLFRTEQDGGLREIYENGSQRSGVSIWWLSVVLGMLLCSWLLYIRRTRAA
jgi:hypothetical protein